ncbi:MAG: hypothetical protein MKZ70_07735, partial [Opitutales bacterium]|nr:hypothetical protein [Opitutales bacterium]
MIPRRRFLNGLIAASAASAFKIAPMVFANSDTEKLKITSVDAYPVKLWERSDQGKLPEFESDFDPRR